MKKKLFFAAAIALLMLSACKSKSETTTFKDDAVNTPARNEELLPEPDAPKEGDIITVSGEVTEITNGKDGYMAKIKRNERSYYTVTVGIVNLTDPKQFKRATVGQHITATGEVFMLGDDIGIKATEFKITE